eukprot:1751736-Amphidinium_carterae.1
MDADEATIATWTNLDDVAAWVGMSEEAMASLWEHLGVDGQSHFRLLAAMPYVDYYLDMWAFNATSPTPALRSQA